MGNIPYSRQEIDNDDIQAVTDVLRGDWLTQGPHVDQFEKDIAAYCGAKYAIAFSNGTAALHGACLALGLKKGDEGIVPPITFAATANCLRYVGAVPLFMDVTDGLPLLNPKLLEKTVSKHTRAIFPVHFSGAACDMPAFWNFAKDRGLHVIEDACHALGASYQVGNEWIKVGSCRHSDMTVFSFHPVKNITTGEGGMITTNNHDLYQKLKTFRQHGISFPDPSEGHPAWYYEMTELGYNYRITDIQAALGSSQLKKLDRFTADRTRLFDRYQTQLAKVNNLKLLTPPKGTRSAFHLATILLDPAINRDDLLAKMRKKGITAHLHYMPVYRQPYYRDLLTLNVEDYPMSEKYFKGGMTLPLFPSLSNENQDFIVKTLLEETQ